MNSVFFVFNVTHANGSRGDRADISNTDAARITKLHIQMLHDESRKPVYFGVTRSKVMLTSHKTVPMMMMMMAWVFALF